MQRDGFLFAFSDTPFWFLTCSEEKRRQELFLLPFGSPRTDQKLLCPSLASTVLSLVQSSSAAIPGAQPGPVNSTSERTKNFLKRQKRHPFSPIAAGSTAAVRPDQFHRLSEPAGPSFGLGWGRRKVRGPPLLAVARSAGSAVCTTSFCCDLEQTSGSQQNIYESSTPLQEAFCLQLCPLPPLCLASREARPLCELGLHYTAVGSASIYTELLSLVRHAFG